MMEIPFLDLRAQLEEGDAEIRAAIDTVCRNCNFILGVQVAQFEESFAAYCDCTQGVGVGTGLDALKLILRALEIGPGDEVITAANSFVASALAITAVGARPVLADVEPSTLLLSAETVRPHITPRTRAIMPVHLYGMPCEMDGLARLATEHGFDLVEDACQAHGARYHGRRTGSLSRAAAFSFYPGKNLGAFGDGGAVTTNDAVLAERIRALRNYGSVIKYAHDELGENSRLDTLQAAVLEVKLRWLDEWNARRRRIAQLYLERLRDLEEVVLPGMTPDAEAVFHLFVVRCERRAELMEWLQKNGIQTLIHYPIPIHLQRAFRDTGWNRGDFPVTEEASDRILSLPIGPHVTEQQVDYVCGAIRDFYYER